MSISKRYSISEAVFNSSHDYFLPHQLEQHSNTLKASHETIAELIITTHVILTNVC